MTFLYNFLRFLYISNDVRVVKGYEEFNRLITKKNIRNEFQIWEYKVNTKQYLLSIWDREANLHSNIVFEKMEGQGSTREVALKYFLEKYGNEFFNYNKKVVVYSYSSYRKGMRINKPLDTKFHGVQMLITKNYRNYIVNYVPEEGSAVMGFQKII